MPHFQKRDIFFWGENYCTPLIHAPFFGVWGIIINKKMGHYFGAKLDSQKIENFGGINWGAPSMTLLSRSVPRALAAGPCGSGEWLGTQRGVVGD